MQDSLVTVRFLVYFFVPPSLALLFLLWQFVLRPLFKRSSIGKAKNILLPRPFTRPSWDDYLLGLAKIVSARSHDSETRHGCVLVGKNHEILATGCNGFPRGLNDDGSLPTTRPEKYPWMIHSEVNALAATRASKADLSDATAYVTGPPCFDCLIQMWQAGVKRVVHIAGYGWKMDEQERDNREKFLKQSGMEVIPKLPDLSWFRDFINNLDISTFDTDELIEELSNRRPYLAAASTSSQFAMQFAEKFEVDNIRYMRLLNYLNDDKQAIVERVLEDGKLQQLLIAAFAKRFADDDAKPASTTWSDCVITTSDVDVIVHRVMSQDNMEKLVVESLRVEGMFITSPASQRDLDSLNSGKGWPEPLPIEPPTAEQANTIKLILNSPSVKESALNWLRTRGHIISHKLEFNANGSIRATCSLKSIESQPYEICDDLARKSCYELANKCYGAC